MQGKEVRSDAKKQGTEALLNMRVVADWIGLKYETLKKKVQANDIPHVRISARCVRFEKNAILEWIVERRVTPIRKPLSLVRCGRR